MTMRHGLILAAAMLAASTSASFAENMTVVLRNSHPNALRLELYSQDRDHVWPGGGADYYLDDGEVKEVSISCQSGETICYGAWIDGDETTYWGVGLGDQQSCSDCCYVCEGGATEQIDLVE